MWPLNEIRELVHQVDIDEDELEKVNKFVEKLLSVSKRVLKREWNVVKRVTNITNQAA